MIRVVLYLIAIAGIAFGAVWLADRPGDVAITWLGRRIETSVMVLAIAVVATSAATLMLWSLMRALVRSPHRVRQYMRVRRGVRGYLAVSQGLIAVGSGDVRTARKFMEEANRVAPGEALTLLLRAQTAQLSGDREAAVRNFERMAERDDTRLLGLHGLFIEARRRNDAASSILHAEEAAKHASVPAWAGQAVLEFRCVGGDWNGALDRLERNMNAGLIDRNTYQRQRVVLLTAQALAAEASDRDRAKALSLEAVKLAPALVPAAALAGRLLAEAGDRRRAARILETAWRANPHPELAEAYAHLQSGDSARERLARVEALAARSPGNVEAALAVARAALDAREFVVARQALAPLTAAPTRRVASLMAELEQTQHGDEGRAREWMMRALQARRDPAWTADGFISEHWLPVSPVTGRLDAFEWKDPLAGDDQAGALIEAEAASTLESRHEVTALPRESTAELPHEPLRGKEAESAREQGPARIELVESASQPATEADRVKEGTLSAPEPSLPSERAQRRGRRVTPVPVPAAVIPLVHAPDDPGAGSESDSGDDAGSEPSSWPRHRQLYRP